MSQDNVAIARQEIEAFNQRDVEGLVGVTTPDFAWTTSVMAVEGEVFCGRLGVEAYFQRMHETWDEFQTLIDDSRDLGDRVLLSGRVEGRGRGSGVSVVAPLDILYDFRGGKISRKHSFLDHSEALRAAGLEE